MAPETTFSNWLSEEEKQAIERENRSCFTSVIFVNCFHFSYLSSYYHFSAFYFPSQYKPNFPSTVAQYFLRWCLVYEQILSSLFFPLPIWPRTIINQGQVLVLLSCPVVRASFLKSDEKSCILHMFPHSAAGRSVASWKKRQIRPKVS